MLSLVYPDTNVIDLAAKRRERALRDVEQVAVQALREQGHPSVYSRPPDGGAA